MNGLFNCYSFVFIHINVFSAIKFLFMKFIYYIVKVQADKDAALLSCLLLKDILLIFKINFLFILNNIPFINSFFKSLHNKIHYKIINRIIKGSNCLMLYVTYVYASFT